MVKKGDIILAIDENRELIVEGLWGKASTIVDFSGEYLTTNIVDTNGHKVFGSRGFRFADEGIIWRKL